MVVTPVGGPASTAARLAALGLGILLLGGRPAAAVRALRPTDGPTHLVLVVVDTLRADRLGADGYPRPTTPYLDRLADRSAVFTQAIAQSSWTRPSMATLMTGLYPTTTGLVCHNFRTPRSDCDVLREPLVTLAELLRDAGFRTAGVVANVNVDPVFGFDQGFEVYVDVPARLADEPDWRQGQAWLSGTTRAVTEEGLRLLSEHEGAEPLFLYLHYLDPHDPYEPPAPHGARFDPAGYAEVPARHRGSAARYDAEVQYVDLQIGRLLDRLDALDRTEDTAVVVVSDHGEEFGEHGGTHHGWTLFDEQTRVPLLVASPGLPARRVDEQVRLLDVAPTLLDLFGLDVPDWMQGQSLVGLVRRGGPAPGPALSERAYAPLTSLRAPPWKLVRDDETGEAALYDLRADPGETDDVSAEHPGVTARLLARLAELRRSAERAAARFAGGGGDVELTPEQIEQLRALGYGDPDSGGSGGE